MSGRGDGAQSEIGPASPNVLVRWECRCRQPPVLLATYDTRGRIHIKARDRYWHVHGTVQTVCPRCGAQHALDFASRES
ncbi:MAG: hypothetical protein H0V00_00195 [Chloroflexia bacterium]|nr:hypothetical protein [Chloroflexia bacterium]